MAPHNHNLNAMNTITSKVSGMGIGGGSHTHSPTYRELLHKACFVITSESDGNLNVYKNRHDGITGDVTGEEFLNIALKMLASKLYNGTTEVFQEAFVQDAKKRLQKVLKKHSKVERMVQ